MTASTHTIKLQQSSRSFNVDSDESILSAALRQGIILPYGCKNGACGSCKATIIEGEVKHRTHSTNALSGEEEKRGQSLLCCAFAQSDVVIDCRELTEASNIGVKKIPVRVTTLNKLTSDVMILTLQLPAHERLLYLAGQYIEIILRDGQRRAYSIALAPHRADHLELHIRHLPGGTFTDHVFEGMKAREILRIEGPFGSFFLREDIAKPIILLASGTGFAPIKSIVEHIAHKQLKRSIFLYWGARKKDDIYLYELAQTWQREMADFHFIPVLSEPLAQDNWQGRQGLVHHAVMQDFPDLSNHQVYACGAPAMVQSAQNDFTNRCLLPIDAFFADAFTSKADINIS